MITLEQPPMALNSTDISWSEVLMWNTWKVDGKQTHVHIVEWVATVASGADGSKSKMLLLTVTACRAGLWYR